MRNLLLALIACAALPGCGMFVLAKAERDAAGGSSVANASQDVQLLRDIAHVNHAEIAAGRLAARKAASPQLRKYGQQMADEHGKAQAQTAALAKERGMTLPGSPDSDRTAAAKDLEQLSGEDFDRAYLELAVRDHRDSIRLLQRTAAEAQGNDLRTFAQSALPHVRRHLEAAEQLAARR